MAKTLNIAHRGGAGLWPENTVFAFYSAAKAGFDGAELDVQLTADGKLAVFHDFCLNPDLCRDGSGKWLEEGQRLRSIRDLSLAELQSFDVGRPRPGSPYASWHADLFARDGESIPSMSQVIRAVEPFRDFRLFVELKTDPDEPSALARPEALAEAVIAELRARTFIARTILVGFDWRALVHAKRIAPDLPCWFTTKSASSLGAEDINSASGDGWFCPLEKATADAAASARACGLCFGVWTANDETDMKRLLSIGVDVICTDRPDRLQAILAR